ncbi:MAG: hypothetical protein K9M83_03050 [Opitutales bacterium]|jgi:hypothetical protein|nr:hypothetical protein [Opitutales bacterium]
MARKTRSPNHLLGLGLDNSDQHKRITQGEGFSLVGGSQETHERMTETVVKTVEDLSRKGRNLQGADPREVAELLRKHDQSR